MRFEAALQTKPNKASGRRADQRDFHGEESMFLGIKPACAALAIALCAWTTPSRAADAPGVTPTEIKIGGVFPFSGPASSIGLVGRGTLAYVQSINDAGGIQGRKINYVTLDDAY